jgi:hypothetical protein
MDAERGADMAGSRHRRNRDHVFLIVAPKLPSEAQAKRPRNPGDFQPHRSLRDAKARKSCVVTPLFAARDLTAPGSVYRRPDDLGHDAEEKVARSAHAANPSVLRSP